MFLTSEERKFYEQRNFMLSPIARKEMDEGKDEIISFVKAWKNISDDTEVAMLEMLWSFYWDTKTFEQDYQDCFCHEIWIIVLNVVTLVSNAIYSTENNLHPSKTSPDTWKFYLQFKNGKEEMEKRFPKSVLVSSDQTREQEKHLMFQWMEKKEKTFIDLMQNSLLKHFPKMMDIETDWWHVYYLGMKELSIIFFSQTTKIEMLRMVGMEADWYWKGENIWWPEYERRNKERNK